MALPATFIPKRKVYEPVNLFKIIEVLHISSDPSKFLNFLNDIFNNQSYYANKWKDVAINAETLVKFIDLIKRYEANGLQLEGRVLWIFSILLPIYTSGKNINGSDDNHEYSLLLDKISVLIETLLRIVFEQKKYYDNCIEIMQFIIDHYNFTIGQIFKIGISIADQLPSIIPNNNFIAFLHFGLRNISSSNESIEEKTRFIQQLNSLTTIIRLNIEQIYIANYFIGYIVRMLTSLNSQTNSAFTIEVLNLFNLIMPLHPDHSKQLYATELPSIIIKLLFNEQDFEIKSKYLIFLSALCIDLSIRSELQQFLPCSLFDVSCIPVCHENSQFVESIFISFIKVYNDKIEYYHHKVEEKDDSIIHNEYFTLIEKFIRYQVTLIINDDDELLKSKENNCELDDNKNFSLFNRSEKDEYKSLNLIIKTLSRIIDIRLISEEVNKLLIIILEHVYKQFGDFNCFPLELLDLTDTLLLVSYRHLDFCWFLCIDDVKDLAFIRLSKELSSFFTSCNKAGLLNAHELTHVQYLSGLSSKNINEDNIRPSSRKIISENIVSQVLKMQYLTISFLDMNKFLVEEWSIEDCNVESIETVCRKVLLVYLTIEVYGRRENRLSIVSQDSLFNSSQMTEILLELLNDERLGMSEYPKMRRKCIQSLDSIINFNENPIANRLAIFEYVITLLTTKEHMENDIDLLYSSLSCLLALSNKDRNIRRKILTSLPDICHSFTSLDAVDSIQPLLNLCEEISEFASRFEYSHEECVLYIILNALKSHSEILLLQGLKVMYLLGVNSQGFVNRGYCRPEIEEIVLNILWNSTNYKVMLAALKVLNLITREVNMKPYWIPSQHSFSFKKYSGKLAGRTLYQTSTVDLLLYLKNNAKIPSDYFLIVYSYCLSIASNLMCGCSDGSITVSCINDSLIVNALKDKIIIEIVSWIPDSLEFYSILKNKKNLVTLKTSLIIDDCDKNNGTFIDRSLDSLQSTVEKSYIITEKDYKLMNEFLITKVVDSIYSFFCLEEEVSLKIYYRNIKLFKRNPIIASLSFIMLENINNLDIQQRGINILKFFAEHKVDLPSIGMHSPSVLIAVVSVHINVVDINISFCNIIISLAKSDEFVRENLIRFNVASSISKIMFTQVPEPCRLACISIVELMSGKESNVVLLCQNSLVVESILAVLDSLETDLRVQVEGLKALVMIDKKASEFLVKHRKLKTINILKKSKKFLLTILKQEKFTSKGEKQEIEDLLSSTICSNDFCCIS